MRAYVGVLAAVACGAHDESISRLNCILEGLLVRPSAPAAADDFGALGMGVLHRENRIRSVPAIGANELETDDLHIPVDAGDTHGVVA